MRDQRRVETIKELGYLETRWMTYARCYKTLNRTAEGMS